MILRIGELDCSVYDRSVKKRLSSVWNKNAAQIGTPAMPAAERSLAEASSMQTVGAEITISGAVAGAVNLLAAKGVRAEVLSAELLLPASSEESLLRSIADQLRVQADRAAVKVESFQAEVTGAVTRPVICVTVRGGVSWPLREQNIKTGGILALGHIGLEGTALLARMRRQELEQRFSVRFLEQAAELDERLYLTQEVEAMERLGICTSCCVPALSGGIYAALWNLAEECRSGFDVELTQIPILQETIELTDFYGINPYQLRSAGAMLVVAANAEESAEQLAEAGYFARPIGRLRGDRNRLIHNGEEVQSLNRPEADSLVRWLAGTSSADNRCSGNRTCRR